MPRIDSGMSSTMAEGFGKALRKLRKERNLTLEALGEKTELDFRTIQRYEAADRSPILENIKRIAEALDITPGQLVDLAYEKTKE